MEVKPIQWNKTWFLPSRGCVNSTVWMHHKNVTGYTEQSWKQHPIKQQLYSHLLPISKPIQVRQTRHMENCWRSKNEINDVLLWTPSHGHASVGWPVLDTYNSSVWNQDVDEDLLGAMDDRDDSWERQENLCQLRDLTMQTIY